ncbi:MAG: YihY/virulence factor BrkB family protein [Deltaproteobacteria bacterium]|nr:YihY/virulence factor BrkB family protein [Deltaproteobacteria bacterium]
MRVFWQLLLETFTSWNKHNAPVFGAALAFYTLFSLAPLLIIITVAVGFFLGQEAVQANLLSRLTEFVGSENAGNIMGIMQNAYRPGSGRTATVIAVLLMFFGSTTVFLMLKNALNSMWEVNDSSGGLLTLVRDRGKSFLVVLLVGLLLLISMVLKSLLVAFYDTISRHLVVPAVVVTVVDHSFSIIFLTILFAILYKVLPDARVPWRFVILGAFISSLLFAVGNVLLGLYLTRQSIASAYGAAGSLVVILMWVYYSALILFLGAEFTRVYARHLGQAIESRTAPPDDREQYYRAENSSHPSRYGEPGDRLRFFRGRRSAISFQQNQWVGETKRKTSDPPS